MFANSRHKPLINYIAIWVQDTVPCILATVCSSDQSLFLKFLILSIHIFNFLPYSGLFVRGKVFTNWPYLTLNFVRENFSCIPKEQ